MFLKHETRSSFLPAAQAVRRRISLRDVKRDAAISLSKARKCGGWLLCLEALVMHPLRQRVFPLRIAQAEDPAPSRSRTNHARNHFFLACDLNEIPRRIAALFMASGERPVCLTTSSSEVEERASSINRRSSFNDQRRLTIMKPLFRTRPPSGVYSPGGLAGG